VTTRDGEANVGYVSVPRESTDVFRVARIDNPLTAPLLPGPVDVYVGDEFLMTGDVDFTAPGGELELGLGVEQGIKVARNTRFREQSAGLMGGSLLLEHHVDVELENHTERPVDIEVRERVPVVREGDDDVRIELREVEPDWQPFEPFPSQAADERLRGGHRWRVALERGKKQTLSFAYTVKIASKHELAGGNRRE
jgi:uncharacterized protein (TIGR02231 family)